MISRDSLAWALGSRATVHLQQMPADSVVLVNDPAICERAAAAVTRIRGIPFPKYQTINVFRLGPVYVVNRPDGHAGLDAFVLDQNFKILLGWGI
jgi:membrane-bound lytic murein transglycosylase B